MPIELARLGRSLDTSFVCQEVGECRDKEIYGAELRN